MAGNILQSGAFYSHIVTGVFWRNSSESYVQNFSACLSTGEGNEPGDQPLPGQGLGGSGSNISLFQSTVTCQMSPVNSQQIPGIHEQT